MSTNQTIGIVLLIIGMAGLIYGVFMIFSGNLDNTYAWVGAILGLIFFGSGIGLMKSAGGSSADTGDS